MSAIVVMGVSGAGKTDVGKALAAALRWPFYEGDDYHSAANVEKMRHAIALTDADRAPWLDALHTLVTRIVREDSRGVVTCSALKQAYRDRLVRDLPEGSVQFVYLDVPRDVLLHRLQTRRGHFAPPELLASQLATLEVPDDALCVDGARAAIDIVAQIRTSLGI